jgi:SAM-dependent methyltransferase
MGLLPFVKRDDAFMLVVGMTGVNMGDRFVQVGCEDGGRLGAVAAKVGLSGQALAIVPDDRAAARAQQGAARAGVLVDVVVSPPTALAADAGAFDVAVVDDTGGLVTSLSSSDRAAAIGELLRILRPGGRVVFITGTPKSGISAIFGRGEEGAPEAASRVILESLGGAGLRAVRTLAERDGMTFIEGMKPR